MILDENNKMLTINLVDEHQNFESSIDDISQAYKNLLLSFDKSGFTVLVIDGIIYMES